MKLIKIIGILVLLIIPFVFSQSISVINVYQITITNPGSLSTRCVELGITGQMTLDSETSLQHIQQIEQFIEDGCPNSNYPPRPPEPNKNIIKREITL